MWGQAFAGEVGHAHAGRALAVLICTIIHHMIDARNGKSKKKKKEK